MPVEIFGLPAIICLILGIISGLNMAKKDDEEEF
jgi:hypothetical protein